jgi:hypothetical protein
LIMGSLPPPRMLRQMFLHETPLRKGHLAISVHATEITEERPGIVTARRSPLRELPDLR